MKPLFDRIHVWLSAHAPEVLAAFRPGAGEEEILAAEKEIGVALPDAVPTPVRGMVPLQVDDPEQVQRLYEIALEHGGAGEGAPCERGGLYAAYFRDPDGNRLNAFCIGAH